MPQSEPCLVAEADRSVAATWPPLALRAPHAKPAAVVEPVDAAELEEEDTAGRIGGELARVVGQVSEDIEDIAAGVVVGSLEEVEGEAAVAVAAEVAKVALVLVDCQLRPQTQERKCPPVP